MAIDSRNLQSARTFSPPDKDKDGSVLLLLTAVTAAYWWCLLPNFLHSFPALTTDARISHWGMWHFTQCLFEWKTNPFWTDVIYFPFGTSLLHNVCPHYHGLIASLTYIFHPSLALPYNLILFTSPILSGWATYKLARTLRCDHLSSMFGALVFAFNPYILVCTMLCGELPYHAVQVLPFVGWRFVVACQRPTLMNKFWVSLCLLWAWMCGSYMLYFCGILIVLMSLFSRLSPVIHFPPRRKDCSLWFRNGRRILMAVNLLATLVFIYTVIAYGQKAYHGQGTFTQILKDVLPIQLLVLSWGILFWSYRSITFSVRRHVSPSGNEIRTLWHVILLTACVAMPLIITTGIMVIGGDFPSPGLRWRGHTSVPGGPFNFLLPTAHHFLWGPFVYEWLYQPLFYAGGDMEQRLCIGWTSLGVLWAFTRRTSHHFARVWAWILGIYLTFTLGYSIYLFGVNTYFPLPYYFIFQMPILANFRNATAFMIPAMLSVAVLCALGLSYTTTNQSRAKKWKPWLLLILIFEMWPQPLNIQTPGSSASMTALKEASPGTVLNIPWSVRIPPQPVDMIGKFDALPMTAQTIHHHPIVTGGMARVNRQLKKNFIHHPFLGALVDWQEQGDPTFPATLTGPALSRFRKHFHLRYVLVWCDQLPHKHHEALIRAWRLTPITGRREKDDPAAIYEFSKS